VSVIAVVTEATNYGYGQARSPIMGLRRKSRFDSPHLASIRLCARRTSPLWRHAVFTLWLVHSPSTRWRSNNTTVALALSVVRTGWGLSVVAVVFVLHCVVYPSVPIVRFGSGDLRGV
jgi:hypothetical protein